MANITLFTGKGGVGKTTCAAATALHHASLGSRTLTISTDATPSLSHIFESTDTTVPAPVAPSLYIAEIGETEIRRMWDEKFGREVHEVFSVFVDIGYEDFVEFMTSVLPGLSEEFMVDYIREMTATGEYENIVWDTAPLGQTLSLLETPALLGKHLRMAPRVYSRLRLGRRCREPVLQILKRWEELSAENMAFLRNEVTFAMVTIPEALAVEQLEGVFCELGRFGLAVDEIILNHVADRTGSGFLSEKSEQQRSYVEHIHEHYAGLKVSEVPEFAHEVKGISRLRKVERVLFPS